MIANDALDPEAVRVIKRLMAEVKRSAALEEELRRYDAIIKQTGIKIRDEEKPELIKSGQELRRKLNTLRRRGVEEEIPVEDIREEKRKLAKEYRRVFHRQLSMEDAETFLRRFIPPQALAPVTEEAPPAQNDAPDPLPTHD